MTLAETLQICLRSRVVTGDDAVRYGEQALWNSATAPSPLAIAECQTVEQVQQAVRIAADQHITVSVLAGGHDWAGRAISAGGLTLDLRPLREVTVDVNALEVTVGGGALTTDLLQRLPFDLVTVTGTVLSVGVAGLTTGGGYGRLNSRFGLAIDTLKSAEVVLADGRLVRTSDQENADLFWALRGGGGNFGVVTSMTMSLYQVPTLMNATLFVPLSSARKALLTLQAILDSAPDELSVLSGFMTLPSGDPGLFLMPLWSGDKKGGDQWLQELSSLDDAQTVLQTWCTYKETFDPKADEAWPKGRNYRVDARNFARLDEATADILLEGARTLPSAACAIVLHDFRGVPSRVAKDTTAFSLRRDHFNCELIGAWDGSSDKEGDKERAWVQNLAARLSNPFIPGGYANLLAPNDTEVVRQFFGESCPRLEQIKRQVDPTDLFRSNPGRLTAA